MSRNNRGRSNSTRRNGEARPQRTPLGASNSVQDLQQTMFIYRTHLEGLIMSRIQWEGLPDTVDERFLERILMTRGQAVFFKSKLGHLMATMVEIVGPGDVYDNPVTFNAIGNNGFFEQVRYQEMDKLGKPTGRVRGEGFVLFDTLSRYNRYPLVQFYADKLTQTDIKMDKNMKQQQYMTILVGPQAAAGDLQRVSRALEMSEDGIVVSPQFAASNPVQSLSTNVKFMNAEFNAAKLAILNEFNSQFGINHIQYQKKSHLTEGEVDVSVDAIARIREDFMVPRQKLADSINKAYGLNVTVKWRVTEEEKMTESNEEEGDDE